jgi:group I intron endonuclease
MAYGYIYIIENNDRQKVYIGCTTQSPKKRWRQHKTMAKYGHDNCPYLYNAMRKYGIDNFKFYPIAKAKNKEQLFLMERAFISLYNTHFEDGGYNIEFGGTGSNRWHKKTREKISSKVTRRKIDVYTLDGELYDTCKSVHHASKKYSAHKSGIVKCCRGRAYTCGGYIFRYKGDSLNKFELKPEYGNASKPVAKYDLDGNLLKTYNSATEAIQELPTNNIGGVTRCCNGNLETSSGFIWKYT